MNDPQIIGSIIISIATIISAFVIGRYSGTKKGNIKGYKKGFEEGYEKGIERGEKNGYVEGFKIGCYEASRYNLTRFMDNYLNLLNDTIEKINEGREFKVIKANSRAIVENIKEWRNLQKHIDSLLNGLVDTLENAILENNEDKIKEIILALKASYPNKKLVIETELEKLVVNKDQNIFYHKTPSGAPDM